MRPIVLAVMVCMYVGAMTYIGGSALVEAQRMENSAKFNIVR